MTPEDQFAEVVERFAAEPDVEEGTGFHNPGLKANGKIFAMLVRGVLVVKLSAARCEERVDARTATPFVIGRRTMREWIEIDHAHADAWLDLAAEALAFARAAR
ncbi:MAG: hypothetical protein JWN32_3680 [Solirubrobacterales bacterium]|jgi:hypothetical protein|nr:hypothetical protein [Solirubrobacterales bacterium]